MVNGAQRRSQLRAAVARRTFFDGVMFMFHRCIANPLTLLLLLFVLIFVVSEVVETTGPLELLDALVSSELKATTTNKAEKFVLSLVDKFLKFVIIYKLKVVAASAYLVFLTLNPSKLRFTVFALCFLTVFAFPSVAITLHLITATALVFYLGLPRLEHKTIVVVLFAIVIVVYLNVVVINTTPVKGSVR
uniref:Uncharacterized protein n=1 Tax=Hammarskog virga-like virus TaxID=2665440 RepID=A0A5Q0V0R2_9VIRU|nr:hypothetical protein [Hammarskog virga-like virus]